MTPDAPVAVIGAGIAGLIAARALTTAGRKVTVFEKSRGRGGRMATRRTDAGPFDHGAQFFTVRTESFRAEVARWIAEGAAAPWTGRVVRLPGGAPEDTERFVGTPGMSSVGRFLAAGLDLRLRSRVAAVREGTGGWCLDVVDAEPAGPFGTVVVATPAEQAAPLLGAVSELADRVGRLRTFPCWALMVDFAEPVRTAFDAAEIGAGPLGWVAHEASKPGRSGDTAWVLHATAGWTLQRLDSSAARVEDTLLRAFADLVDAPLPDRRFVRAHLWRFARTANPLGGDCLWDAARRLGACGDWCVGARVEAAFQSGSALAARVLAG